MTPQDARALALHSRDLTPLQHEAFWDFVERHTDYPNSITALVIDARVWAQYATRRAELVANCDGNPESSDYDRADNALRDFDAGLPPHHEDHT